MIRHLEIEDSSKTFIFSSKMKHPFPTPCSIEYALRHFVDLTGMVSKKTLKNLAPYCLHPIEKRRMLHLSENSEAMKNEITSKRYGLLDLFT
jgi:NADPH-ferrihemoprotein reductase